MTVNGAGSYWLADAGGSPRSSERLTGGRSSDVAIVGAGFTGLWTAYYLKRARPDLSISIIEGRFAGFGASGRNGGFLFGSFPWPRRRFGADSPAGDQSVRTFEQSLRAAVDEVLRVVKTEEIDADVLKCGNLTVAITESQWARLVERHRSNLAHGLPADVEELLSGDEVRERVNIDAAKGALYSREAARVQPAKLVRGLASRVCDLGVELFEMSPVRFVEPGRVVADGGVVSAPVVVIATEGFTSNLPGHRRRILPINSSMMVTERLPEEVWSHLNWQGSELVGSAGHSPVYIQRTRDNRVAIGGRGKPYRFGSRVDQDGKVPRGTMEALRQALEVRFPVLTGVAIEHIWCGVVGVPRDWCPSVVFDRETGLASAGGYVGNGLSASNLAGRTLRDLIVGEESTLTKLPWVNRHSPNWEVEPLRWLGVQLINRLYLHADRVEGTANMSTARSGRLADLISGRY